jgi:hypothetical protein
MVDIDLYCPINEIQEAMLASNDEVWYRGSTGYDRLMKQPCSEHSEWPVAAISPRYLRGRAARNMGASRRLAQQPGHW